MTRISFFQGGVDMLVLSRKAKQAIVLKTETGEEVYLYVNQIERNGVVRIGIKAPKSIKILRSEIANNAGTAPPM